MKLDKQFDGMISDKILQYGTMGKLISDRV